MLIIEVIHIVSFLGVAQSCQELFDTLEAHDLILDGVVGCLDASVLLLEGLFDDAE